jgi:hypothetical protein
VQAPNPADDVHVVDHVAEDQNTVALTPEREMAWGVTRNVEDLKAGDLIALVQHPVDVAAGAAEVAHPEVGERMAGLDLGELRGLLRIGHLLLSHPVVEPELPADLVRRSGVVGVRVREGVRPDRVPLQLPEDSPGRVPRAGVDQHILREVDVDHVGREAAQLPNAVGDLLHVS